MSESLRAELERKTAERDALFTPGAFESYYRDRFDRYDRLTRDIVDIELQIEADNANDFLKAQS